MKKTIQSLITIVVITLLATSAAYAQNNVGINTTAPDPSAALDITSTDKGVLIPRMIQTQRDAITNPAPALMIYQTDGTKGFYYNSGAAAAPVWSAVGGSGSAGASFELWVTKTAAEAQTMLFGTNYTLPNAITFSNTNSPNALLTGGNTWDGAAGKFTCGTTGVGLYWVDIQMGVLS